MTDRKWVILELSRKGEKEDPNILDKILRVTLQKDDIDVFVPAISFSRRETSVTICLMEGYAFVEAGHSAQVYYDLESSDYVAKVLSTAGHGRHLYYLEDEKIQEMKKDLKERAFRDHQIGDVVDIVEGVYESLTGRIVDILMDQARAFVRIEELKSIETIVELPFTFLNKR